MIALILVAGYATRLYPLTKDKPKPLLPVNGKPMLDYIMDELDTLPDISRIYLVSNHRFAGHFEDWAIEYRKHTPGIPVQVMDDGTESEDDRKGAIGDIQFVIEQIAPQEDMLIVAGDNLFTYRLADVHKHFMKIQKDMLVAISIPQKDRLQQFAVADLDENGKILHLEEKPQNPKSNTAIFAVYFYKKETLPLFSEYLNEGNSPDSPGNFPAWLYKRQDVYAFRANGICIDIGTPETYKEVNENFDLIWEKKK